MSSSKRPRTGNSNSSTVNPYGSDRALASNSDGAFFVSPSAKKSRPEPSPNASNNASNNGFGHHEEEHSEGPTDREIEMFSVEVGNIVRKYQGGPVRQDDYSRSAHEYNTLDKIIQLKEKYPSLKVTKEWKELEKFEKQIQTGLGVQLGGKRKHYKRSRKFKARKNRKVRRTRKY